MAEGNIAGLGRFDTRKSAAGESYIQGIRQAGQTIAGLGTGLAKVQMEIGRREAEARSMVKDADFTNDQGPQSMFSDEAQRLKNKIGGLDEDSYDFSKVADIARFNEDVKRFNNNVNNFEEIYKMVGENLKTLEADHNLFAAVGQDPNQAATTKVAGVEVYNSKASSDRFNEAVRNADALRNASIKLETLPADSPYYDGAGGQKYVARDSNGKIITAFSSPEEYLESLVEISKPDFQPVPVLEGARKVEKENWHRTLPTEIQAESRFVNHVLNNPQEAIRRAAEKAGGIATDYAPTYTNPKAESLINKHPNSSEGFDKMSDDQYEYVQELLQGWRDMQAPKEKKTSPTSQSSSGKKLQELSGRISQYTYTQDETLGGPAGIALKGEVFRGENTPNPMYMQGIYVGNDGRFYLTLSDKSGGALDPIDISPGSMEIPEVMAALGLSTSDYNALLKNIWNKSGLGQ